MMSAEVEEKLKSIVGQVLDIDIAVIDDRSNAETMPQWDSVHHINIILKIEDEFDIAFEESDFSKMADFGALRDIVLQRLAA